MPAPFHKLLNRQLRQAALGSGGGLDQDALLTAVSQAYTEFDVNQRRVDRANRLMAEELERILDERKAISLERAERVAQLEKAQSALAESEARALHLACHDVLTGLPNRALLGNRLGAGLKRGGLVAIHCLDLDHFKNVNDTFGHQAGDELIQRVAAILIETCAPSDLVARLGGDEFAVVQFDTNPEAASRLAKSIVFKLSQPFDLEVGRVSVGCSVGISLVKDRAAEPLEALRQADLALYAAKDKGRGGFAFFCSEMDSAVRARQEISNELREAITRDEITLAYQPQVDSAGVIVGVEALAQWNHRNRGALPPSLFVPIAEENGLIVELGLLVLRKAFEDSKRWPGLRIAVNISSVHLRSSSFVQSIRELVRELNVSPSRFEFELPESVLIRDDPVITRTLEQLTRLGFSIALDDFGTGYSSLSYLRRYPISKIKIDKSFISNLKQGSNANAFLEALVLLAHSLSLSVVAEGIETTDQWGILSAVGCNEGQGFLFSDPVSQQAIDCMINESRHRKLA